MLGKPEVMAQIGSAGDYLRLARRPTTIVDWTVESPITALTGEWYRVLTAKAAGERVSSRFMKQPPS